MPQFSTFFKRCNKSNMKTISEQKKNRDLPNKVHVGNLQCGTNSWLEKQKQGNNHRKGQRTQLLFWAVIYDLSSEILDLQLIMHAC